MKLNLKKRSEAFTIIEVLIVLAIAGLILLIVFLAVPALQRNSRNTQRNNDVAGLLGAASEFANNNNGILPTKVSAGTTAGTVVFGCASGTCTSSEAKVGYYNKGVNCNTVGCVSITTTATQSAFGGTGATAAAKDRVLIVSTGDCTAANGTQSGAARAIAAIYEIENGSSNYAAACKAS